MKPLKTKAEPSRKRGRPRKNALQTDAEEESHENKMTSKVFDLEPLRERILDYVIHNEDVKKAEDEDDEHNPIDDIRSCRLVSKVWLKSVSRILEKCQEPLFRFKLSNADGQPKEQSFDQFVESLSKKRCLEEHVPPYVVSVWFHDLQKKNYQTFYKFLAKHGSGLVELKLVAFPKNKWKPMLIRHDPVKLICRRFAYLDGELRES